MLIPIWSWIQPARVKTNLATSSTNLNRDVNFPEFYFSIREFQISRLIEYSKLDAALGVDDALNAWMLPHCRYHAAQLWLGGCPWEVERGTGSCSGVKLQSPPVSLMYLCLVRPDRQTSVIPGSSHAVAVIAQQWTLNSQSRADWLGRVNSLELISKSWSFTDAVLITRRIQRACSLLNDATPAMPTDPSHVASGPLLPSPVDLLRLLTRLPTGRQQVDSRIALSTVVKRSSIVGPAVYCTVLNSWQREIQCSIPINFFRVSSLVSLVNVPESKLARWLAEAGSDRQSGMHIPLVA